MAAKRTPNNGNGLPFLHCTPFPLVQKLTDIDSTTATQDEPPHWMKAFEAEMQMGEAEAQELLSSYKSQTTDLYDQAMRGDEMAAAVLVQYASIATQALEHIARRKPAVLHPLSVHNIRWPSFISIKEFDTERNRELLKTLQLGTKSPFRHKWNPKSPATLTAYSIFYWLHVNQSVLGLPTLSEATFDRWFETGWAAFSASLRGQPETYPYLRPLYQKAAEQKVARSREKRNLETVIREIIKKAVKQGFTSVTKNCLS